MFQRTSQNINMWKSAFRNSSNPDIIPFVSDMLRALLTFPCQVDVAPYSVDLIQTLVVYVKHCEVDLTLATDVVVKRLQTMLSHHPLQSEDDKGKATFYLEDLTRELEKRSQDIWQSAGGFEGNLEKMLAFNTAIISLRGKIQSSYGRNSCGGADRPAEEDTLGMWLTTPTIGWLADPRNFQLHGKGMRNFYDTAEEYVLTLRSVWTMLTFYWGVAALWPLCTCSDIRGGVESRCGKPLFWECSPSQYNCTMRIRRADAAHASVQCDRPAIWKCAIGKHKTAICSRCLPVQKSRRLEPRGGSTDLYDGQVRQTSVDNDSNVLFIEGLVSRNVPKVAPNWRTTYRLQCAALIGIVKVDLHEGQLINDMVIHWAEIVSPRQQGRSNGPNRGDEEYKRRERGQLSARLLSRTDCNALPGHMDNPFEEGCHVVIIDFQVFSPEVISVLATLFHPSFTDAFSRIPFAEAILGRVAINDISPLIPDANFDVPKMVVTAIYTSTIESLRRLPDHLKRTIVHQICSLGVVKTLDRTQCMAFAIGLANATHCTQGPPGTGKVS